MKNIFVAALAALAFSTGVASAAPCSKGCCPQVVMASAKSNAGVKKTTLSAPKIHCAGCLEGIKATLLKQDGVRAVSGDARKKTVTISYVSAKTNPKKLAAVMTKAGWPAKEVKPAAKAKPVSATKGCSPYMKEAGEKI